MGTIAYIPVKILHRGTVKAKIKAQAKRLNMELSPAQLEWRIYLNGYLNVHPNFRAKDKTTAEYTKVHSLVWDAWYAGFRAAMKNYDAQRQYLKKIKRAS